MKKARINSERIQLISPFCNTKGSMCAATNAQCKPNQTRPLPSLWPIWSGHTPMLTTLSAFHCPPSRNQNPSHASIYITLYNPPTLDFIWLFSCSLYDALSGIRARQRAHALPSYCPPSLPYHSLLGNSYSYFRIQYILFPLESLPWPPRIVMSACNSIL